uniref:sugar MFS transporter n=2 Tax=Alloprevotella sp. TaxID=1872471 RepID=UPI004029241A
MKKLKLFQADNGVNYLVPFILVTTLFFLWGFAHSILDVLNKHFQDAFTMNKTRSALVQAVVYGGYFIMALPAGRIIRRFGYRTGVSTGLLLYGIGALMFIPGSYINSFEFFLLSLFIIGCGLTCLETAANPYVTVLGPSDSAERRINISQSFNGLGWILGPLVGGLCVLGDNSNIALPYAVIGVVVLLVFFVFLRLPLPEIESSEQGDDALQQRARRTRLFSHPHFLFGLTALFCYVAAQTGINSFFINYADESAGVPKEEAAMWLGLLGMGLFMAGRMVGSYLMKYLSPERLLAYFGVGASLSMLVIMLVAGRMGFYFFFLCFLCESIMFPTIFALAIRGLGEHTKTASSLLIMCIVGGAVAPVIMGAIADYSHNMALSFVIPLICFVIICCYAAAYRKLCS